MNQLALTLTTAWLRSPFYHLAAAPSAAATPPPSGAATDQANLCTGLQTGDSTADCTGSSLTHSLQSIIQTLLIVAGAVAVLIVIIGGIRYVTSTGDATRVKQAKDTIMYAIAGLVISMLAYAIVSFVSGSI
jgi:hypothetical protein